ncbi:MAG TPA: DUF1772 domain-containing protein [Terriglobales bacterium]
MDVATIVRVIALACAGMLAGIFFGYRMGAYYALQKLDSSSFVQFQQVVHAHYVKFMPPLTLSALLAALAWLFTIRSHRSSAEFWLVSASTCGIALIAAMTRAVNVPLNNKLMTWNVAAPPTDLRAIWAPWDRVNTIRTFVSAGVLLLEAAAANLGA